PYTFAAGLGAPDIVGGVWSMLMPLTAPDPELPALSLQTPEADWFAPSLLSVTGAEQLPMPDNASVPLKLAVTEVLFHPLAFAFGERPAVTAGFVLSTFTVTLEELVTPSPLVAEHVTVAPAVSLVNVVAPQPFDEAMPDSGSDTLQLMLTSPVYQPLRPC